MNGFELFSSENIEFKIFLPRVTPDHQGLDSLPRFVSLSLKDKWLVFLFPSESLAKGSLQAINGANQIRCVVVFVKGPSLETCNLSLIVQANTTNKQPIHTCTVNFFLAIPYFIQKFT